MPEIVICQYRLQPGANEAFLALLGPHRDALRELELVTDTPFQTFIGRDRGDEVDTVVEIFEWVDADAARAAHTHPQISAIWERMDPLCESMRFPHFVAVDVP